MFSSLGIFFSGLDFIDYIFFFSILFMIVLVISLVCFIKANIDDKTEVFDPDNLRSIASSIKTGPRKVQLSSYEKQQEEKAIISYEELLENTGEFKLNYIEEEKKESEVNVKKVDLENLISESIEGPMPKIEVQVISLEKEEEFLKLLKDIQKNLS